MDGYDNFNRFNDDIRSLYSELYTYLKDCQAQSLIDVIKAYANDSHRILDYVQYCLGNEEQLPEAYDWRK